MRVHALYIEYCKILENSCMIMCTDTVHVTAEKGWEPEEGACQLRVYVCPAHSPFFDHRYCSCASYEAAISMLWRYLPTPVSNAALRSQPAAVPRPRQKGTRR